MAATSSSINIFKELKLLSSKIHRQMRFSAIIRFPFLNAKNISNNNRRFQSTLRTHALPGKRVIKKTHKENDLKPIYPPFPY